jgi:hypothetical protein
VKYLLHNVANYKRVIYVLKREERLLELFLEKQYILCRIAKYFYPIESYQAYKNMWKEARCVSLQISFHGMISHLYMTVFSNYIVSSLNCILNGITNLASNYIQYFVIRGFLFFTDRIKLEY